jgi:flagellar protein FlgJ
MSIPAISDQFAIDVNGLNALKLQARANSPESNKAVARQFEALFLQTVLKSMRDATPHDGIFDSDQSRMYESMLDQQLAQMLATKGSGTGLAAMIEKQLSRVNVDPQELGNLPLSPAPRPYSLPGAAPGIPLPQDSSASPVNTSSVVSPSSGSVPQAARGFVDRLWPHALEASRATSIPAQFIVAQAALETGWGKSEPRLADGRSSFNLFGIKAGKSWNGPTVAATTSEVVAGAVQKSVESFRVYASYAEAFRDYANLLGSSPRYANVVGSRDAASFAHGLQQAGYASDPMYAAKLIRIIGGSTLRNSLSQASQITQA